MHPHLTICALAAWPGEIRLKLLHNDYTETHDVTKGADPRPSRGPGERNGSCKVPAPSIDQELPQWKQAPSVFILCFYSISTISLNLSASSYLLLPGRVSPPQVLLASVDLQTLPWGEDKVTTGTEFSITGECNQVQEMKLLQIWTPKY